MMFGVFKKAKKELVASIEPGVRVMYGWIRIGNTDEIVEHVHVTHRKEMGGGKMAATECTLNFHPDGTVTFGEPQSKIETIHYNLPYRRDSAEWIRDEIIDPIICVF